MESGAPKLQRPATVFRFHGPVQRKLEIDPLQEGHHGRPAARGGDVPADLLVIAVSISVATHNIYAGLWWPIATALLSFVVGGLFLPETNKTRIWDEVDGEPAYAATGGGQ